MARSAILAAYGPDNTRATKLVVSIMGSRDQLIEMRKWITVAVDMREDPVIAASVAEFLTEHHVRKRIETGVIIGCPHEEGIDYPMGRVCPQCPFWARRDRFTHELTAPPVATMTPEEVLKELSGNHSRPPLRALESADALREELAAPLLDILEAAVEDPSGLPEDDAGLFSYALYLFAKWRDPRAYPLVCRWLSLPDEIPFEIGGDIPAQDGPRLLASVFDGNLEPIKTLILDTTADEFGRGAGVEALAVLAAWAEVPRQVVVDHLAWLVREGLEREPTQVWNALCGACMDIEAREAFGDLRRAYADGLIDPQFINPDHLDPEASQMDSTLEDFKERCQPIYDVATAISWWGQFHDRHPKVGRNEPCPCGSGKKYKRCHGQ